MNKLIIANLFEFWTCIGNCNDRLSLEQGYRTVSMIDSDWPNRVYAVSDSDQNLPFIVERMRRGDIPSSITMAVSNNLANFQELKFGFPQKNMALELKNTSEVTDTHIVRAVTKKQLSDFARTASGSFGYRVDPEVVYQTSLEMEKVYFFIYQNEGVVLGCGIVYLDENQNAGLHMIGTLASGRGQGIGKKMTQHLMHIGKSKGAKMATLQASAMGENIYRKLGFKTYGGMETYRLNK